jgi:predicted type IV restriction endonuclease
MATTAPQSVLDLVARFAEHADAYHRGRYNETQLRREFVDPLFKALGWDVDNSQGYAEAYKDVIHEDAIKVGGATEAPDYCFRIGGVRKFFVEAKKPSVDIKGAPGPAFQLRRYAWSAKLPLSILTDFEELAVYDCRVRPAKTDKPSKARTLFIRYDELPERWDELASVFAREAILKGSFDKYAESARRKRGTAEVDEAFLAEIEQWRDALARNIALRNRGLSQRDLNFAVQRTIDRIVFLRISEDRGVEPYGTLQGLVNGENVYRRLFERFERADERYNSGLFHFSDEKGRPEGPDELTPSLTLDDKVLKGILGRLYYPESPYEFSVLPADILGQVYERFLGKVIRLTPGHRAKVEEKPEVRKAGGVYYTPTYIVDYIVAHTVGELVKDRAPQEVGGLTKTFRPSKAKGARPLAVLDPACGSGSFLLGAYQFLLDWYRDRYLEDGPEKHAAGRQPRLYQHASGEWRLTTAERKRILLAHIHGVDIDAQAVEVTKLSLLLKVLEGESDETIGANLRLLHERALPDLAANIKCGNSLIGPDFYEGRQLAMFDEEERLRINAFDWQTEFRDIMAGGGFDAVIGNPPWGQKAVADTDDVKHYVREHYPSTAGIYDMFRPFVERGIRLLNMGGRFGMVLPDIVLLKDYPETRRFLLDSLDLRHIDWWGMAFADAVVDTATITGTVTSRQDNNVVQVGIHDAERPLQHEIPQADFEDNPRYVFNLFLTPPKREVITRLERFPKLGDFFEIHEGVHSGNIRRELFVAQKTDGSCEELLFGRDEIHPYHLSWNGRFIRLGAVPEKKTRKRYANVGQEEWHRQPKVLVRRTGDYVLAAVDRVGRFASNNFFLIFPYRPCALDLSGLCALLNSTFITWYFRTIEPRKGRVFAELKIKHLRTFPLPRDVERNPVCQELNGLGYEQAKLTESIAGKKRPPHEHQSAKRAQAQLDRQIDILVGDAFDVPQEVANELATLSR